MLRRVAQARPQKVRLAKTTITQPSPANHQTLSPRPPVFRSATRLPTHPALLSISMSNHFFPASLLQLPAMN